MIGITLESNHSIHLLYFNIRIKLLIFLCECFNLSTRCALGRLYTNIYIHNSTKQVVHKRPICDKTKLLLVITSSAYSREILLYIVTVHFSS